jgi:hypothetical protein
MEDSRWPFSIFHSQCLCGFCPFLWRGDDFIGRVAVDGMVRCYSRHGTQASRYGFSSRKWQLNLKAPIQMLLTRRGWRLAGSSWKTWATRLDRYAAASGTQCRGLILTSAPACDKFFHVVAITKSTKNEGG